jgi:hypothetical protein
MANPRDVIIDLEDLDQEGLDELGLVKGRNFKFVRAIKD